MLRQLNLSRWREINSLNWRQILMWPPWKIPGLADGYNCVYTMVHADFREVRLRLFYLMTRNPTIHPIRIRRWGSHSQVRGSSGSNHWAYSIVIKSICRIRPYSMINTISQITLHICHGGCVVGKFLLGVELLHVLFRRCSPSSRRASLISPSRRARLISLFSPLLV